MAKVRNSLRMDHLMSATLKTAIGMDKDTLSTPKIIYAMLNSSKAGSSASDFFLLILIIY